MIDITECLEPITRNQDDLKSLLPASHMNHRFGIYAPLDDIRTFLEQEFSLTRINYIQGLLWLAGRERRPSPLSAQRSLSRQIIVDENISMHLVWEREPDRRIYVKPLPQYLLDARFWAQHLMCTRAGDHPCTFLGEGSGIHGQANSSDQVHEVTDCPHFKLYRLTLGFLNSYVALIRYPSDFTIAQDHGLVPSSLLWTDWSSFVQSLIQNDNLSPYRYDLRTRNIFNPRYNYGELSLSRLNRIYFFKGYRQGYRSKDTGFPELLHEYFRPITALTVYIVLVLTAMQVGLATETLQNNKAFQNAFTVLAIIGPLALSLIIALLIFGPIFVGFYSNLLATFVFQRHRERLLADQNL